MTKRNRTRKFTEEFKLRVMVDYYSSSLTPAEAARKWNVDYASIFQWRKLWPVDSKSLSLCPEVIERYRMEHKETPEKSDEEILRSRIASLEQALKLEKMRSRAFEKMIEIAEAEEGISILKKGGAKQ